MPFNLRSVGNNKNIETLFISKPNVIYMFGAEKLNSAKSRVKQCEVLLWLVFTFSVCVCLCLWCLVVVVLVGMSTSIEKTQQQEIIEHK